MSETKKQNDDRKEDGQQNGQQALQLKIKEGYFEGYNVEKVIHEIAKELKNEYDQNPNLHQYIIFNETILLNSIRDHIYDHDDLYDPDSDQNKGEFFKNLVIDSDFIFWNRYSED